MTEAYDNAHVAGLLLTLMGVLLFLLGLITLSVGILLFIGFNLFAVILPKYIISSLLPQDISFIDGIIIASGASIIIISRLFHTDSKWIKLNERKGGLLAILLSLSSIALLAFFVVYLNLTALGDVVYSLIFIFLAIILSVIINWNKMAGGLEEVLPGIGYFIAMCFSIFIIFGFLYIFFPLQLSSITSVGTSSFYSILSGNFGVKTFNSTKLNYNYPSNTININLAGIVSSATSAFSISNVSNTTGTQNLLRNSSLNIIIPNAFLLSAAGNSPLFINNLRNMNLSYYFRQNASSARNYLQNKFPPLSNMYMYFVGYERLNSTNNISIFNIPPSELSYYLKSMNSTKVNSSFPINVTNYIYSNLSYGAFNGLLPSQLLLVNISNKVGIELSYNQNKLFNITRIPFYAASILLYENTSMICFEIGADFPQSQLHNFETSFNVIQKTLRCN